jgi:hypothetical protein
MIRSIVLGHTTGRTDRRGPISGSRFAAAGGDGGIRTLDRALQPYNGLANRRLQPLGHVSVHAENGALLMRFHMLAEVCPSPGAMARPRAVEQRWSLPAARPRRSVWLGTQSVTRGWCLCALQQSHTPTKKGRPANLCFTRTAPTLSYGQEGDCARIKAGRHWRPRELNI